jgi:hypothetical protein
MLAALLIPLQLAATIAATRYESTTQSESTGAVPRLSQRSVFTTSGHDARIDVIERTGPTSPTDFMMGSYTVVRGGEKKMYSVDTVKHEYYELDPAVMKAQLREMMKGLAGMGMKFSSFTIKVEDMGDGEIITGHPTRHWRIQNTIEMSAAMGGDTFQLRMDVTGDNFYAKDITNPKDPTVASDSAIMVQFGDFIPEQDAAKIRAEMSRLPQTPQLKSVSKMNSRMGPTDMTVTTTNLVTKIETVNVPRSFFDLPKHYKKVEMPKIVPSGMIQ